MTHALDLLFRVDFAILIAINVGMLLFLVGYVGYAIYSVAKGETQ